MTVQLEALHEANFGGAHQVLFLMDSLEREEAFYSSRNGHLSRRDGFYIYYEKENMGSWQDALPATEVVYAKSSSAEGGPSASDPAEQKFAEQADDEQEKSVFDAFSFGKGIVHRGNYRRQVVKQEEAHGVPSYASTLLLTIVVCALGITAYMNNQKMEAMEATLAQMNQTQTSMSQSVTEATEASTEIPPVNVENVSGEVQPLEDSADDAQEGQPETGDANTVDGENVTPSETDADVDVIIGEVPAGETTDATATDVAAVQNEAAIYLQQGYYIVQKGDSLVGICRKIYQTTAMLDKLCEVNGIEDRDSIYAGQYLVLPN